MQFSFLFLLGLFLLLGQNHSPEALLAAVANHELGHIVLLFIQRRPPKELNISAFGLCLKRSDKAASALEEALLYLAGPAANLAAFAFMEPDSLGAAFQLLLGLINLLPVEPLDGGNCLRLFLERLLPFDRADKGCRMISLLALGLLALGGAALLYWQNNPALLLFALLLSQRKK